MTQPNQYEDKELRKAVEGLLSDDYACTRVWEAWQVGTMTDEDFEPLNETTRVDEIMQLITKKQLEARLDEFAIVIGIWSKASELGTKAEALQVREALLARQAELKKGLQ